MKRNLQNVFNEVRRSPSFTLSKMKTGKAIVVLMLAVIAVAFTLSNPQRTSSAVVKNAENRFLPVPQETPPTCENVPPSDCVPDGDGFRCCSTDSATGDRTCRFESESCELIDNPCGGASIVAFVRKTITIRTHVDSHGGRHFRTHLEIHGKTPTADQCSNIGSAGGNRFDFVKTSMNQGAGDIISLVKNSGFNSSGPPPETFDDPLNVHIITTDGTPNFNLHLTLHTTENANGKITSCISHERTSCPDPVPGN